MLRETTIPRETTDDRMVERCRPPRCEESVERVDAAGENIVENTEHVELGGRPRVLRGDQVARGGKVLTRPDVRLAIDAHKALAARPHAAERGAWPVVADRPAEEREITTPERR